MQLAACESHPSPEGAAAAEALLELEIPHEFESAEQLYEDTCTECHGARGLGSESGPALVDPIYRPSHHADASFLLAVRLGVRAHHWRFGDMPAIPQLSEDTVREITRYIRWLQRARGID